MRAVIQARANAPSPYDSRKRCLSEASRNTGAPLRIERSISNVRSAGPGLSSSSLWEPGVCARVAPCGHVSSYISTS